MLVSHAFRVFLFFPAEDDVYIFKGVSIPYEDHLPHADKVTAKKCLEMCHNDERCFSFEFSEKEQGCDMSNVTHLTHELTLNRGDWDIHILNPGQ